MHGQGRDQHLGWPVAWRADRTVHRPVHRTADPGLHQHSGLERPRMGAGHLGQAQNADPHKSHQAGTKPEHK